MSSGRDTGEASSRNEVSRCLTPFRPLIREDHRIDWWYRQNVVMFANEAAISTNSALRDTLNDDQGLEWVHINTLFPPHAGVRHLLVGVRNVLGQVRPVLGRAIRKRFLARAGTISVPTPRV